MTSVQDCFASSDAELADQCITWQLMISQGRSIRQFVQTTYFFCITRMKAIRSLSWSSDSLSCQAGILPLPFFAMASMLASLSFKTASEVNDGTWSALPAGVLASPAGL